MTAVQRTPLMAAAPHTVTVERIETHPDVAALRPLTGEVAIVERVAGVVRRVCCTDTQCACTPRLAAGFAHAYGACFDVEHSDGLAVSR